MKKFTFSIAFFIVTLLLSSCVKDYTCQCRLTFSGKPGLPEPQIREYSLSNTLKEAKQECESRSRTYEVDGVRTVEECELY